MLPSLRGLILCHFHRHAEASSQLPDAELLNRFVVGRDEAAFELLLWRHGGMVRRACQSLLDDVHPAEDAFQATFLILARARSCCGTARNSSWSTAFRRKRPAKAGTPTYFAFFSVGFAAMIGAERATAIVAQAAPA